MRKNIKFLSCILVWYGFTYDFFQKRLNKSGIDITQIVKYRLTEVVYRGVQVDLVEEPDWADTQVDGTEDGEPSFLHFDPAGRGARIREDGQLDGELVLPEGDTSIAEHGHPEDKEFRMGPVCLQCPEADGRRDGEVVTGDGGEDRRCSLEALKVGNPSGAAGQLADVRGVLLEL